MQSVAFHAAIKPCVPSQNKADKNKNRALLQSVTIRVAVIIAPLPQGALAETKKKAVQVRDKLVAAGEMRQGIDEKREQYRPVATRGAVMYFTVVDLSLVNVMYQTSLDQFQTLFTRYSSAKQVGL